MGRGCDTFLIYILIKALISSTIIVLINNNAYSPLFFCCLAAIWLKRHKKYQKTIERHTRDLHFSKCANLSEQSRVENVWGGLILYHCTAANMRGEEPRLGELHLTAHWMWWIAHPCPVMCMHIWCWNGLSTGPLSFNHVKAKYRIEHIFCCLVLLLCHSLWRTLPVQKRPFILLHMFRFNFICLHDYCIKRVWICPL